MDLIKFPRIFILELLNSFITKEKTIDNNLGNCYEKLQLKNIAVTISCLATHEIVIQ